MKKQLRVKDLFLDLDEKFGIRQSEVSLAKFLPSSYQYALIERNSSNRCKIYLKEYFSDLPKFFVRFLIMLLCQVFPLVVLTFSYNDYGNID